MRFFWQFSLDINLYILWRTASYTCNHISKRTVLNNFKIRLLSLIPDLVKQNTGACLCNVAIMVWEEGKLPEQHCDLKAHHIWRTAEVKMVATTDRGSVMTTTTSHSTQLHLCKNRWVSENDIPVNKSQRRTWIPTTIPDLVSLLDHMNTAQKPHLWLLMKIMPWECHG